MSKSVHKKSVSDRLKEQHANEMAEKDRAMEMLRKEMEERQEEYEKQLEEARMDRCVETALMEGMQVGGNVGNISEVSSKSHGTQTQQLPLIEGMKVNCKKYVNNTLFPHLKFAEDDTFNESPKILEEAMKRFNVVDELEKVQQSEAAKREIKNCLTKRRSYMKVRQGNKYIGKRQ
jgi:hypothetical protein